MKKILANSFTFALLIIAGLFVLQMVIGPQTAETPPALAGPASLDEAIAQAEQDNRVVFAVATAPWCGPCQGYKRTTLADADVQSWIESNAVGLLINTDENPEDASRLQVRSIPATYIIQDGTVVNRFVGAVSRDELLEALKPYELAGAK
jgi:thioredoxin-like negative regulator of GroEL